MEQQKHVSMGKGNYMPARKNGARKKSLPPKLTFASGERAYNCTYIKLNSHVVCA